MRRVVVTGIGVVSSIGDSKKEVVRSLKEGCSGIRFVPEMRQLGLKCCVAGPVRSADKSLIDRRARANMSRAAQFAALAALEAIDEAMFPREMLRSPGVSVVVGTEFGGIGELSKTERLLLKHRKPSRVGIKGLVRIQHSTASANMAAWLGVQGRAYSIASSFCSGADNIGHAYELIGRGLADVCIAGASEEATWMHIGVFLENAFGMPSTWNDQPEKACRPYDRHREGTVISEGAGILILEALEHAQQRNVAPYAEVVGYGSANDGFDMFRPSGEGLKDCLQQALAQAGEKGMSRLDYINSDGIGTQIHDPLEVKVLREVLGTDSPPVSSTKSLTGHCLGASGAIEAAFALLMLRHGFIASTANLDQIDQECQGIPHVRSPTDAALDTVMTYNTGLGGSNACLIFRRP